MLFRMFKMIATSGFLTALECTKFCWGLTALLQTPSWFKGYLLLKGGRGKGRRAGEEGEGRREEGKGRESGREGEGTTTNAKTWICPTSAMYQYYITKY